MRVLAVENEAHLDTATVSALTREGFAIDLAQTVQAGSDLLAGDHYDLVLLILSSPSVAKLDFLRTVRRHHSDIPIIIVSPADSVDERVRGLTAGADDYIVKPFAIPELVARMRVALRRPGVALGRELRFDGIVFNILNASVKVHSKPLTVPRRELAILESLMRANGSVVTKPTLEASAYAQGDEPASNVLEANVSRLRRRIREAGAAVDIKVVRGVGYRLDSANIQTPARSSHAA